MVPNALKKIHNYIHSLIQYIQQTLFESLLCSWHCVKTQGTTQSLLSHRAPSMTLNGHTWKAAIDKQAASLFKCRRVRTLPFQFKRAE